MHFLFEEHLVEPLYQYEYSDKHFSSQGISDQVFDVYNNDNNDDDKKKIIFMQHWINCFNF